MNKIKRKEYVFIRICSTLLGLFAAIWGVVMAFSGGLSEAGNALYGFFMFLFGLTLVLAIGLNIPALFAGSFWDGYEIKKRENKEV